MNRRGMIHHIDLNVADLARSAAFYDRVLGFLGYSRVKADDGFDWIAPRAVGSYLSIALYQAEAGQKRHDRYAPGLHHLALSVDSRADVDALYRLALEIGAEILDSPREYPQYNPGYYAVFFLDPYGVKLEGVFSPESNEPGNSR